MFLASECACAFTLRLIEPHYRDPWQLAAAREVLAGACPILVEG
jgi:hypothetical protein